MYLPKHFAETRTDVLHGLIRDCPFATVVASTAAGLVANHLPFERVGDALHGHVARGNELARLDGAEVLAIFRADGFDRAAVIGEMRDGIPRVEVA